MSEQRITQSSRGDTTLYMIGGIPEDGRVPYNWFSRQSLPEVLAKALSKAEEAQQQAEKHHRVARSYLDAVASARGMLSDAERIDGYRAAILRHLDGAQYWLITPHTRVDTWPESHAADLLDVRRVVEGCSHEPSLERWLMICERHHNDWATRLMDACLGSEAE